MPDLVHLFGGRPRRRLEAERLATMPSQELPVGADAAILLGRKRRRRNGQSLVEFALVIPLLLALVGAIVQFGMVFWAQNTLTQVVRDTGRWAATHQSCTDGVGVNSEADLVASNSALFGFTSGEWGTPGSSSATVYTTDAQVAGFNATEGVAVAWIKDSDTASPPEGCPPKDNQAVYHVTIRINHTVPTFFPGMQYLPGLGTCTSSGCQIVLSSTAQFRMEPAP